MIKMQRSQSSAIKAMIYPEVKKTDKNFHSKNISDLRKLQTDQRNKKHEKENFVARKY
jgi:hypothetical protein